MIKVKKSIASLDFLNKIIAGSMAYIPFHNLTLINAKHRPDVDSIISDMLNGIGGLCNVRNSFLYMLLNNIGFNVQFLSATMKQPNCHILLLVIIDDEKYIVDIGNGFPYLEAINIHENKTYYHLYLQYKVIEIDGCFCMRHKTSGDWFTNYSFNLNPVLFSSFDNMLDKQYSQKGWGPFLTGIRINKWTKNSGLVIRNTLCLKLSNGKTKEKYQLKNFNDLIEKEFLDNNFITKVNIKTAWQEVNNENNC